MKISRIVVLLMGMALFASACGGGNVFSLEVGTCFDDEAAPGTEPTQLSNVPVVECDTAHDNEVFALFDVPDGDFPGQSVVETQAFEGCVERFDAFVGVSYEESSLGLYPLYPTSGSWDQGDREVICALYDSGLAKLEGSMQGSNR